MKKINWQSQHCGIIHGEYSDIIEYMPDLKEPLSTFPENPNDFIWDVKVHMLMPNQYPCIPNWHRDMIPRDENLKEDETLIDDTKPMYLWLSNSPLTIFKTKDGQEFEIIPEQWHRFTQRDWHKGQMATDFCWRGLIRACHKDLGINSTTVNNPFSNRNPLRRHTQVYLDASNFKW
ncbi:hypothetical protein [Flavobacterium sp. JP2137]|uniref:hypothetical protein n=1 Tax=Flavobacterium sp. JP2137 TaxID=3414510 RepID=UPI003D2FE20F